MTRWAPAKADTLAAIATEILHNYGGARAVIAIDSLDSTASSRFADDLADAFAALSHESRRATVDSGTTPDKRAARPTADTAASFGEDAVAPFRADGDSPAVLIVDGRYLLDAPLRGKWNYSIWLDGADSVSGDGSSELDQAYLTESRPRASAVAIVDVSDSDHPRRVFADAC